MNYGLDVEQFRIHVVVPALYALEPVISYTSAAEKLVLGTSLQESALRALRQYGGGPALGVFQMEPATHRSLWLNSISPSLGVRLRNLLGDNHFADPVPSDMALIGNLIYAAAMCRVRYYIVPAKLPLENDPVGMTQYWLKYYNAGGKGTVEAALSHFQRACKHEV